MEWKITVWDDVQIAYIATAKVANTAVKAALLASYVEDRRWGNPHAEGTPYVEASSAELRSTYADYLTVALSRNPYDRFVSFYSDKIVGNGWYGALRGAGFRRNMSFEDCALAAAHSPDGKTDPHAASQVDRLVDADGTFLPDMVLRFEHLAEDWTALQTIADARAPQTPLVPLTARRTSEHASWQSYYTPKAQRAIAKRYAKDFQVLGYSKSLTPEPPQSRSVTSEDSLAAIGAAVTDGAIVADAAGYDAVRATAVADAGGQYLPFGGAAGTMSRGRAADRLVRKLNDGPRCVVLVPPRADRSAFGPDRDNIELVEVSTVKRPLLARLLGR